jgi:predicted nucleic acid-binding protein
MPTAGRRRPDALVDTSVAVALLVADHAQHESVLRALDGRRLGLSGHAAFETFSVLSRLPAPARRPAVLVSRLLAENFPASRFLSGQAASTLLGGLAGKGIAGGQVYDALVGAAALEHGAVLVTRDRRAVDTYRALGVELDVLDP